jgi:hypothetical protein
MILATFADGTEILSSHIIPNRESENLQKYLNVLQDLKISSPCRESNPSRPECSPSLHLLSYPSSVPSTLTDKKLHCARECICMFIIYRYISCPLSCVAGVYKGSILKRRILRIMLAGADLSWVTDNWVQFHIGISVAAPEPSASKWCCYWLLKTKAFFSPARSVIFFFSSRISLRRLERLKLQCGLTQ